MNSFLRPGAALMGRLRFRGKGAHGVQGRFSKRHACNFLTHGGR